MKHLRFAVTNRGVVRELVFVAALAATIFSPGVMVALAQAPSQGGAPDIVASLKATPGVLGVDAGQMASRKQVIFAWFENKQAVLNWVSSDAHLALMRTFAPGASTGRKPLADVPDDSGPILAIASLTMADKATVPGVRMPISQIAIELYVPIPGGLAAGGRFAPNTVKVQGLIETTP